ncbi:MAG: hypothetical protein J6L98_04445 [Bacteroidales bacterium]|nr:hypothetical protein [Bacteroidales bacterium]
MKNALGEMIASRVGGLRCESEGEVDEVLDAEALGAEVEDRPFGSAQGPPFGSAQGPVLSFGNLAGRSGCRA